MDRWAYVFDSKKKDYLTTKYAKFFYQFKDNSPRSNNPEYESKAPSLALL